MTAKYKHLITTIISLLVDKDSSRCLTAQDLEGNNTDWNELLPILQYHGINSFVYPLLKNLNTHLPEKDFNALRTHYYKTQACNLRVENTFFSVKNIFDKYGIAFVPIKGMSHLFDLYQNMPSRPMCDLDILIKEEDYARAKLRLSKIDYTKQMSDKDENYWLEHQMHVHFSPSATSVPGCILEMHWRLDYKRTYPVLPDLWERIRSVPYKDRNIDILSPEDTLFSLALHQRRFGMPLQLKYALDTALIFKKYSNVLDKDYLIKESRRSRMQTSLYVLLKQSSLIYTDNILKEIIETLHVGFVRKIVCNAMILKYSFSVPRDTKKIFTWLHLFLFDNWNEPILYMLNIPYEQFCKYYQLPPDQNRSRFYYKIRYLYYLWNFIGTMVTKLLLLNSKNKK